MSEPIDRRTRKRLATRQAISNAATRLFWERGFEAVTVDDIAEAADVGRMTVFNHFPRKEDMFFDREEEGREVLRSALRDGDGATTPIEALRQLAHRLVAERAPYVVFSPESQNFVRTIEASETLKARARAIRDELAEVVASALAETAGRASGDPDARLAAALLLAVWSTAFAEAHRIFRQTGDAEDASSALLGIVDQGTVGVLAAMAGTPYC
ncbi:TetR/AcrR family transcriptional regulator [Mesorhizobium sp. BR1-1-16]|uniref:TetR/AcrR family transcriptional regulator n=1 Tax=Mesorhizobium sp. BR1-1-16 TaxID=2876653 RepID=UPI001CCD6655|nr:TetR/AcrR family transcriptional regulator [Mesorhizobium sp. BR1-1-16]MBZ9938937.1 TetR/AcrR family transcriptional regulator [Mesorhizobium sp. BR1-1-16]